MGNATSINLLDDVTLPDIMNCLGNPNDTLDKPRLLSLIHILGAFSFLGEHEVNIENQK